MVPVLVYIAGVAVGEAIAISLITVAVSSAFAAIQYLRKGFVNRRLVFLFVLPGIVTSFVGARVSEAVSPDRLLLMFGALMILIGGILILKHTDRKPESEQIVCRPGVTVSVLAGSAIGFLTGLLGVGGGFLIVPVIALLMRCSLYTAIGTSLAIIALNSVIGFAGHLSMMPMNWFLTATVVISTLAGALWGVRYSAKISAGHLQKGFAALILLIGILIVVQNFSG